MVLPRILSTSTDLVNVAHEALGDSENEVSSS